MQKPKKSVIKTPTRTSDGSPTPRTAGPKRSADDLLKIMGGSRVIKKNVPEKKAVVETIPTLKTKKAQTIPTSSGGSPEIVKKKDNTKVFLNKQTSSSAGTTSKKVSHDGRTLTKEKSSSSTIPTIRGKKTIEKTSTVSSRPSEGGIRKIKYGGLDGKKKTFVKKITKEGRNSTSVKVKARRS